MFEHSNWCAYSFTKSAIAPIVTAICSADIIAEKVSGKKEISLTVYLDNENYPETTINLYRYGGKDCLAVLDGEAFTLINRSDVADLNEAVSAMVLN